MSKSRTTIFGELTSPELEARYQTENATQDRRRMTAICLVTSIAYFLAIIINVMDFGFGPELSLMFSLRSATLVLGLFAAYIAWNTKLNRYFSPVIIVYMIMIDISESIEAVVQFNSGTGMVVPMAIIIVLMYYLFIPVRFVIALIPSVFMSVAYTSSIAFFTNAETSYVVNLLIFFLLANIYGVFHMTTFNRIRRNEFHALIEQQRLNDKLHKEIVIRREAEHRLFGLATIDDLTGIHNRRHFMELFMHEIKRAHRYNNLLSLMMLDVDYFKSVNDTYGHVVGDIVLKHLAKMIQANLRELDIVARFGGEEFIVLLPNTDLKSAHEVAERICLIVSETPIDISEAMLTISVSIGVVTLCKSCNSMEAMIKVADDALYKAKKDGRNRTVTMCELAEF